MKVIISVVGRDQVGIIAAICNSLVEHRVNVLDISQTILQDYFNMIMIVDCPEEGLVFNELQESLQSIAKTMGLVVKVQRDELFKAMHRI